MLLRDIPGYCLYFIPYVLLSEWITPEACVGPSLCAVWLAGGMAGKRVGDWSSIPGPPTAVEQHRTCCALPSPRGDSTHPAVFTVHLLCARPARQGKG
jgi:solute carrier family 25 protein 48